MFRFWYCCTQIVSGYANERLVEAGVPLALDTKEQNFAF